MPSVDKSCWFGFLCGIGFTERAKEVTSVTTEPNAVQSKLGSFWEAKHIY